MKKFFHITGRDLFLATIALVVLFQQVFLAHAAQPLLIFLVIFLFASIPALRGDRKEGYGPFARFIMTVMGIHIDAIEEAERGAKHGKSSSPDTPTPSDSAPAEDSSSS